MALGALRLPLGGFGSIDRPFATKRQEPGAKSGSEATMQTRTSQGQNFQDSILDNLRGRRAPATLYLNNRMALHGRILDFDPYVLLLEPADGGPIQMVYKSA